MTTPTSLSAADPNRWLDIFLATVAVAFPTLIAFNVSPSATFFNQAAAFVGWGGFLLVAATVVTMRLRDWSPGLKAAEGSLGLVVVATLGASVVVSAPWSLSLSSAGTTASAALTIVVAGGLSQADQGRRFFRAFCVALVIAGIAGSAIGLVQVFATRWPDGDWIALAALPGRASGNLRQPNHLSSLLLWSVVAAVWLGEARILRRDIAAALMVAFLYVIVLTGSRTGALAMLVLGLWGALDHRLARKTRWLLMLAPLTYGAMWGGTSFWATHSHHLFGGQTRFGGSGDISSSRFGVWSNTLSLIKAHPWFGVGMGEFNFAWTLTPFPDRPVAFFDHTHNIALNFVVELGIPMALVVLAAMVFALWKALQNAIAAGRTPAQDGELQVPVERAAFVIVTLVAMHSMLEYPLWYSYFLLPTAFALGLCLERPGNVSSLVVPTPAPSVARPLVIASMLLALGGTLAVYDYMRVVVIFDPPVTAGPLEKRIADGRRSILFGHHADYAAATVDEHPGKEIDAFKRATHYLLDARLMMAWANALNENGETDKARYVAQRLREFRNPLAEDFFEPCKAAAATRVPAAASAASSPAATLPFQCLAPTKSLSYEDFR